MNSNTPLPETSDANGSEISNIENNFNKKIDIVQDSISQPDTKKEAKVSKKNIKSNEKSQIMESEEVQSPPENEIDAAQTATANEVSEENPLEPSQTSEVKAALPGADLFGDVISGQFDAELADEAAPVPKRVLQPQAEAPKLHKVLAQSGMGSRLEMEQLIIEGRITVNNEPAHIGQRIQFGDHIKVNGKPIRVRIDPPPARVIAYHKPAGEVVTHDDPQNRPTVFRRLPKLHQGKWQSVGRLDLNTEGLLLFTNSGGLANNLMHPRFGLEREYAVRVLGNLSTEEKRKLLDGVTLDDGIAQFGSIEAGGGEGANCWYRVTISEGRNREVRRMIEAVGHAVSRLIRIRYGAMMLPKGLKRGAWMELDERDIRLLNDAVDRSGSPDGPGSGPAQRQHGGGNGPIHRSQRGPQNGPQRGPQGGQQRGPQRSQPNNRAGGAQRGPRQGGMSEQDLEFQPPSSPTTPAFQGLRRSGRTGGPRGDGNRAAPRDFPSDSARPNTGGAPRFGRNPARNTGSHAFPSDRAAPQDRPPAGNQPDPMKTSLGYIGADSYSRQRQSPRRQGGFNGPGGPGNSGGPGGPRGPGGNSGGPRGGNRSGGGRGRR